MGAATQLTDLSDLRTEFLQRVHEATGVTATNTMADRYLNIALHDIHINTSVNFLWAVRRAVLITHAPYSTGTVSITAATSRTAVVGSSTLWNTAVTGFGFNNARAGGKMTFSGSTDVHVVSAVGSDTAITLESNWTGADLSGASYNYFEDEYALASDFGRPLDQRLFSSDLDIPLIGAMEFRRRYPRNSSTAKPKVATLIQLGFSGSTTPRPRIVLHPPPDDEYSIPYDYITTNLAVTSAGAEQAQLVNNTDEPIIPLKYRHVIMLHAVSNWLFKKDDARSQEAKAEYVELVMRMSNDGVIGQDRPRFRPSIGQYFGSRRRGRFDWGNRFDELKDR